MGEHGLALLRYALQVLLLDLLGSKLLFQTIMQVFVRHLFSCGDLFIDLVKYQICLRVWTLDQPMQKLFVPIFLILNCWILLHFGRWVVYLTENLLFLKDCWYSFPDVLLDVWCHVEISYSAIYAFPCYAFFRRFASW